MSFTPIVAGIDMFSVSLLNEIVEGVAERCHACNDYFTPPSSVVAGTDVHAAAFWSNLQTLCSNMVSYNFVDPTVGPGGYSEGAPPISPMGGLAYTLSGMSASGWRRATSYDPLVNDWTDVDDPMFEYGFMSEGDIIGPWILDDLQRILKVMTVNHDHPGAFPGGVSTYFEVREALSEILHPTCAAALAANADDWTIRSSWVAGGIRWVTYVQLNELGGTGWNATSRRCRAQSTRTMWTGKNSEVDVYYYPILVQCNFDSLPNLTVNTYYFHETIASSNTSPRSSSFVGDGDNPMPLSTLACPTEGTQQLLDYTSTGLPIWIIRWAFTNVD
jgi:hypothetical protein